MAEGTVKFFNRTKGFGFISVNDSNEDIYVHESGLIDNIVRTTKFNLRPKAAKKD